MRIYTFFKVKTLIFVIIIKLPGNGECHYPEEQNGNLRKKRKGKIEER
jgi:hypothetical protein